MLSYWPNIIWNSSPLKAAAQARLSLHLSKCHIVGKSHVAAMYAAFSQKYQGKSGPVTNAFDGTNLSFLPHFRALVFFLLAEHHWKFRFKELIIRHSYSVNSEIFVRTLFRETS